MFTDLRSAITDLDLAATSAGLVEALAVRDLLEARIAVAVGEFDALGVSEVECALKTQSWLRAKPKLDSKSAGRLTALGRRLHRFPALRDAALEGRVSGGQLAIVAACVPERHFALFAEHEAVIVADLQRLGIEGTQILMRSWLARADALDERPEGKAKPNEAQLSQTLDGRGEYRESMDADRYARLEAALRMAEKRDFDKSKTERRADAHDEIVRFFLDHHEHPSGRRNRPHVNVVMTYEQFVNGLGGTYVDTGGPVSKVQAERFRCDGHLHRVLVDAAGAILDYGRQTRQWAPDVFNAIVLRDGGCRFTDCDTPPERCDTHHTREWVADEGETTFWDGCLQCDGHHDLIHRLGLHLKLLPDGTLEITYPDGTVETTAPRGPISPDLWDQRRERRTGDS